MTFLLTDLEGSHPKQLTDGFSVAWNSKCSPGENVIAYTGRDASGILHIYIMDRYTARHHVTYAMWAFSC